MSGDHSRCRLPQRLLPRLNLMRMDLSARSQLAMCGLRIEDIEGRQYSTSYCTGHHTLQSTGYKGARAGDIAHETSTQAELKSAQDDGSVPAAAPIATGGEPLSPIVERMALVCYMDFA